MATKTIACPECGAAVAPGRYACAECGALVAAVGMVPRTWPETTSPAGGTTVLGENGTSNDLASPIPSAAAPQPAQAPATAPKRPRKPRATAPIVSDEPAVSTATAAPSPVTPVTPVAPPARSAVRGATVATAPVSIPDSEVASPSEPPAPPAAASAPGRAALSPFDPRPRQLPVAPSDPTEPHWPDRELDEPAWRTRSPEDRALASPVATWPPANAEPPVEPPPARLLAGAYLSPSAVLPPLDAPLASRNGHAAAAKKARNDDDPTRTSRQRPSLADALDAVGITVDMPRRLVGAGAAMAVLGFLLPWVNALGGGGALLQDYLSYWGLAGPGHWIVAGALLVVVAAAMAERPFARLRVGAIAVATAALLVGLLWTYLFGVPGKSVGVWIVLAGAALLAIGGALDLRRRHDVALPAV